jgi:hypothetical protein
MTDKAEGITPSTNIATSQDLAEVIHEFEQYRERLVNDMTIAAKKAKLPKSKLMARLGPELAHIDATLDNLRMQHAALTEDDNNEQSVMRDSHDAS